LAEISVQTKKTKFKNKDVQVEIEVKEESKRNSFKGQYYRKQSQSSEQEGIDVKGSRSIKNSYSKSNN
jgi:hypothetical protein